MGAQAAPAPAAKSAIRDPLVVEFARLLRERYGARVYLFGSRARGAARPDSDYDLVAVAEAFGAQPRFERALDRRKLWRQAGGWGIGLDLHCYTPSEFRRQVQGLGYLGQSKARGELIPVRIRKAD
ncbi:MAG: nucleotidyltransferase domain-containing protein [Chloroflexota bacterium]|nr:MAG: nucleotidyltransferase domain-containing protein [Chloroflexota bacterium]